MKWISFPKFYGPLTIWPWLRISPHSSLNVIYFLILTAWQWLMSFPVSLCKLNPIKARWGIGSRPFSSERLATFPPQADHVLVDLFSSAIDGGGRVGSTGQCYPTVPGRALAGVAQWTEHGSVDWVWACEQKRCRFDSQSHARVVGQVPSRRCTRGNHTLMFLSLSFSFPSTLSLKKNKT